MLLLALLLAQTPPGSAPAARPPEAVPSGTPGNAAPAEGPAGWKERYDELWKKRDQPGVEQQIFQLCQQQLTAEPKSFEANWRLSALYNWQANTPGIDGDHKAQQGKLAWEAGDKAIAARPGDVRGQYQAGTGIGNYSEGVGILTALSQGLEGKFRDRLQASLKIDKDYLDGMPQVIWGRYFFKLPWPKRNVDESVKVLSEAMESHPNNMRARLYLADSLWDNDKKAEAKRLVQDILDYKGGDDPPEERRLHDLAQDWMKSH
jgi:hypothetical protein